ncbi:MAG: MFS transporter, partial [Ottowia sp.]|nr:MFS transporter [Ottowia sp.]
MPSLHVAAPAPAPPPVAGPGHRRPGALVALTLAMVGVFAFLQVYSVQSILPELQRDLGASVVEVGNAVGVTILAVALVSPMVGMLSDALGRKWLVVACVFVLAVPTALMPLVETTRGLLVLRYLQGLAVPGVTVVTMAYIGEEFRGAAMVRIMTLYITGNVLGGFLGRFLL